jgi:hypothetical protein
MSQELDLDINNYDLDDLLRLFQISKKISAEDLKKAKNIMLKTHPDKSGLDPKFFHFYSEAYKILYGIWEFKQKGNTKNTDYVPFEYTNKADILDNWFRDNKTLKENKNSFNEWFNEQFNNTKIYSETEQKGYDKWLRSRENEENIEIKDIKTMHRYIDEKKKHLRELSLINKQEIEEIWNSNTITASDLSTDAPDNYDSNLFSTLSYQDLQKAHTETIIPITQEDYELKQKFNNVNEYISFRNAQDIKPHDNEDYLRNREIKKEEMSIQTAYNLAKQTELSKKRNEVFWKNIQLLN